MRSAASSNIESDRPLSTPRGWYVDGSRLRHADPLGEQHQAFARAHAFLGEARPVVGEERYADQSRNVERDAEPG
jgi:hypothetical protein